jgi:type I restriction enzyme S subunit
MEHVESDTGRFIGAINAVDVKSNTFHFTPKHVLYGRLRPYLNKVFAPDFEGHCSTEIFPLLPSSELSREYLRYWISSDEICDRINGTCTGARMPRANMDAVLDFEIPLPPLPEQRRIVGILDEAFAGIATARASAEKNLRNARDLFASVLEAIFVARGKGWQDERLGAFSERVSVGHVGETSEFYTEASSGVPFLRSQNVRPMRVSLDGLKYITRAFHERLKKSQLRPHDLLFVRVGANRGDCCAVPDGMGDINCANIVFARPRDGLTKFVECYCQSASGRRTLLGMTTGAAQGVINTRSAADLLVPLPPLAERKRILEKLDELRSETDRLESLYQQKLAALGALKKSLLHQAFSGRLGARAVAEVLAVG